MINIAIKFRIPSDRISTAIGATMENIYFDNVAYSVRHGLSSYGAANTNVISADVEGLNCCDLITAIKDGRVELTEGYLGPEYRTDSVTAGNPVSYTCTTEFNRRVKYIRVICDGAGDFNMSLDSGTNILVTNGMDLQFNLDIKVKTIDITLASGAASTFRLYIQ